MAEISTWAELKDQFQEAYNSNRKIQELLRREPMTYADANEYAIEVSNTLADIYHRDRPLAKTLSDAMAKDLIEPALKNNQHLIADVSAKAQQALNDKLGIGIKAIKPKVVQDRIDGLVTEIVNKGYEKIEKSFSDQLVNYGQSVVDDTVQTNADFHYKAGLRPRIMRRAESKCCEWCSSLGGSYEYPDVPKDVYRRHANCRCSVEYDAGGGKRTTIHAAGDSAQRKAQEKEREERLKKYNSLSAKEKKKYDAMATARKQFASKEENSQEYRSVVRGAPSVFNSGNVRNVAARKIDSYRSEVYVSDKAVIKPKALHTINKNTEAALKAYGVPAGRKPKVIVVDESEMPTAWGRYDAVKNEVYYLPEIADRRIIDKLGSVEYHEMWHAKQAEDFRNAGWTITEENYSKYLEELRRKCKQGLDSVEITGYNVDKISKYASDKYLLGSYDETEAEYYSLKVLERR